MSTEILDRRLAAAERMARVTQLNDSVASQIRDLEFNGMSIRELDPSGTLSAAVHHMIGLATRTPGFDLVLTAGEQRAWGVRLRRNDSSIEISAVEPYPHEPGSLEQDAARRAPASSMNIPASVVSELADMLRSS